MRAGEYPAAVSASANGIAERCTAFARTARAVVTQPNAAMTRTVSVSPPPRNAVRTIMTGSFGSIINRFIRPFAADPTIPPALAASPVRVPTTSAAAADAMPTSRVWRVAYTSSVNMS